MEWGGVGLAKLGLHKQPVIAGGPVATVGDIVIMGIETAIWYRLRGAGEADGGFPTQRQSVSQDNMQMDAAFIAFSTSARAFAIGIRVQYSFLSRVINKYFGYTNLLQK